MAKIKKIVGRQVFDSRGNPTVEAEVFLKNNIKASAIVPSGASTGAFEAYELRDNNKNYFLGKSVLNAVKNINTILNKNLKNIEAGNQKKIDTILLDLDGTDNKNRLGANALLAVSLAVSKAEATSKKKELYQHLGKKFTLPNPLMNIINGGAHADNNLRIQEFMIRPDSAKNFMDAIEKCFLVIQNLKKILPKISFIVMLAGLVGDPIKKKYPTLSRKVNFDGIKKIIRMIIFPQSYFFNITNINFFKTKFL